MPRILLLSGLLLAMSGATAFGADLPVLQEKLLLRADTLRHEQSEDVITAIGTVELEWGSTKLYADMAKYYQSLGVVEVDGKVRMLKDGDTLSGDSARLQLESRTGVVKNGAIFVKTNNLHLTGASIEKVGEQDYRIEHGTITSCDGDKPSWKFGADELQLTVDDFAYGKNATFYLGNLPVFWFPYLVFPAKTERQSGFLIPKGGFSNSKGAFLEIPYYWAISPSQDITVAPTLESKRGGGFDLEHRYLSSNKGQGLTKSFVFYDWEQGRFRGDLNLKQQYNFSEKTYWRADMEVIFDRNYYQEFGISSGEYNKQYTYTTAFLSHSFSSYLATAAADYVTDLDLPNNDRTLQKLPYLTLTGSGERISSTPLYYSLASSLTHFERDQGSRGERLILFPELTLQGKLADSFRSRVSVGYYQLAYNASQAEAANGTSSSGVVKAAASVQTEFSRIYEGSLGEFSRFRHLVVPELKYSFIEKKGVNDLPYSDRDVIAHTGMNDLPFFDYDDRPLGGQLVTLSFANTLTGRSANGDTVAYRDLLRFSLSQGYQLSGKRRDLLVLVDQGRPFTDTALVAELFPLPDWRLFTDTRISPYNGNVTNSAVGVEVGSPKENRINLNYHHAEAELDYIEGTVAYADFKPFLFSFMGRYSFDRSGFLETLYSLEYKSQCWGVLLSYRDRIDDQEVTLTFNLSGLGSFKLL